jgi:hypothetical protein
MKHDFQCLKPSGIFVFLIKYILLKKYIIIYTVYYTLQVQIKSCRLILLNFYFLFLFLF